MSQYGAVINKQSINQSINQSISQSIHPSLNQSIHQSINQLINQTINQPINQSTNQPIDAAMTNKWSKATNKLDRTRTEQSWRTTTTERTCVSITNQAACTHNNHWWHFWMPPNGDTTAQRCKMSQIIHSCPETRESRSAGFRKKPAAIHSETMK